MTNIILFLLLGLVAGIFGGFVGLGGGIIIVPALIFIFGFTQHQAQGTSLATLLPPIGLLAAWTYYKAGFVDIKAAALVCTGFVIGGLIGAKFAVNIPDAALSKVFGVILLLIAIKMIFFK